MSLMLINTMEPADRDAWVHDLIPPMLFENLANLSEPINQPVRSLVDPVTGELHVRVPAQRVDGDYALSLDLEEAGAGQLRLGFIIINDLASPRFCIDRMEGGKLTLLGTAGRNLDAERAAMTAGLGPCQVRKGLRLFGQLLPRLEAFAKRLGYVAFVLDPLTYHNAIMYERYGFAYITGKKRMHEIDDAFGPEGILTSGLDGSTAFRQPQARATARGRSWAIHDGILDRLEPDLYLNLEMVKVIGQHAQHLTFSP